MSSEATPSCRAVRVRPLGFIRGRDGRRSRWRIHIFGQAIRPRNPVQPCGHLGDRRHEPPRCQPRRARAACSSRSSSRPGPSPRSRGEGEVSRPAAAEAEDFCSAACARPVRDHPPHVAGRPPLLDPLLPPDDAPTDPGVAPERSATGFSRCSTSRRARRYAALLAYKETRRRLMNPRYARLRPRWRSTRRSRTARRRASASKRSTTSTWLDAEQRLIGVISFGGSSRRHGKTVRDIMHTTSSPRTSRWTGGALRLFAEHDSRGSRLDDERHVKGIVRDESSTSLRRRRLRTSRSSAVWRPRAPYLEAGFWSMVRKRAGWLRHLHR